MPSYPSGCGGVTATDKFRLVVCVRSHLDKTTTWHDPRLSQLQSAAAQHPISGTPVHSHSLSNPAPTTQPQNINPETGITLAPPSSPPPFPPCSQSSFFIKHRPAFRSSAPSVVGQVFAGCDFSTGFSCLASASMVLGTLVGLITLID